MTYTRALNDQEHTNAIDEYRRLQNVNAALRERHSHVQRVISEAQHEHAYQAFLTSLQEKLDELEQQDHPYADVAQNFLDEVKAVHDAKSQKFVCSKLPTSILNDLLNETDLLLSTNPLLEDGTANPELPKRMASFKQKITRMDEDSSALKTAGLKSAGLALLCIVGVTALAVMMGVMTLGLAAVPTFVGGALLLGFGGRYALQAGGMFSQRSKLQTLSKSSNSFIQEVENSCRLG